MAWNTCIYYRAAYISVVIVHGCLSDLNNLTFIFTDASFFNIKYILNGELNDFHNKQFSFYA